MNLDIILNNIYKLPNQSLSKLKDCFEINYFKKGNVLFDTQSIKPSLYFIKKGIVRAYADRPNTEVTFWFGKEGESIISMKNYIENKKSYENIEILENSELYHIDVNILKELFFEDIHIANWGRKFSEKELLKTEERLISIQFKTASDRYLELIKNNPELIKRVALGHIASYLGITQVSLSRIRAEIK